MYVSFNINLRDSEMFDLHAFHKNLNFCVKIMKTSRKYSLFFLHFRGSKSDIAM